MTEPSNAQPTEVSRLHMALWRPPDGGWVAYLQARLLGAPEHEWVSGADSDSWDEMITLAADWHNEWKAYASLCEEPLYLAIHNPVLF